jgi:hypothetical protein
MDVLYFLTERMKFIRRFYELAGEPFRETMRRIEAEKEPFVPAFSEYGGDIEQPFLSEWLDADTSLELLGRACLSMLSASLQLYFKQWELKFGLSCGMHHKKAFKRGFLHGYQVCFADALGVAWEQCPADLAIVEQVTLARNRDQHPETISTFEVSHSKEDWTRYPRPFFSDEFGRDFEDPDVLGNWWLGPRLRVSREKLFEAIDQVDLLAKWLDQRPTPR